MKFVITGGLGFLGTGIARKLLERDNVDSIVLFDVQIPDQLPEGLPRGLDNRVEMVAGDIADRDQVTALIDRDDIAVFHLASVVSAVTRTTRRSPPSC